jgi:predicted alpha-1,2-mannosidase
MNIPDARVAGSNGLVQGGSNGDVVIADALVKGLTGINYEQAYRAVLQDADVQSPNPLSEGRELRDYLSLGYMSLSQTRSASRTMEYSYDDFAVGEIAERLGHHVDAERMFKRSGNWKNLWNSETHCIQPRYADGKWLENFDCNREYPDQTTAYWGAPYYEGRGVQYSTFVPQDIPGLIDKLNGNERFVKWLDQLFDQRLYTQGNEQDLLAPYLYIYAHRHDRVSERVRKILETEYHDNRSGLPGNDDAGTMSSWYVWSSIGLYPNAGQPYYYIGSPVFTKTTIEIQGGKQFVIEAEANSSENIYVQRAELNGRKLNRSWLLHEEIVAGGKLTLHMGPRPSMWACNGDLPNDDSIRHGTPSGNARLE